MRDDRMKLTGENVERTLSVIRIAMLMTLVVYALVVHFVTPQIAAENIPSEFPGSLRWIFAGIAVVLAGISLTIQNRVPDSTRDTPSVTGFPDEYSRTGSADVHSRFTRTILSLAIAEAIAILGLVLCFLGDGIAVFYGFAVPAAALILLNRSS